MYNVQARHIATPNVILGMALGYGGLVQLIAGIEEWACGNSFGATAFASYGGFWFSFAILYIPQFGVVGEHL
jgi:succinate-acetate transporter protein